MKNLSKSYKFLSVFLLSHLIHFTVLANSKLNEQLNKQGNAHNRYQYNVASKYNVPFLLAMSDDEICVVQFPLIDNGRVSVVYRPFAGGSRIEKEVEEDGSEWLISTLSSSKIASTTNLDGREYEQMPRESTSLGKSEWQQIAANSKPISDGRDREEMGVGESQKELKKDEEKEVNRPRRRSNNLVVDGYEAANSIGNRSSDTRVVSNNNNSNNSYNNAMHESSSSNSNVTSAPFENAQEERTTNKADSRASAEDDKSDSNCGSVQFSDFDVHMALGYAFVADSRGRIHRFRLSGIEKAGSANENLMGHDYTKDFDAVDSGSGANGLSQLKLVKKAAAIEKILGRSSYIRSSGSDSGSSGSDDDGNEVGAQKGNVTHEKFGQHPMVSGNDGSMALSRNSDGTTTTSELTISTNQVSI